MADPDLIEQLLARDPNDRIAHLLLAWRADIESKPFPQFDCRGVMMVSSKADARNAILGVIEDWVSGENQEHKGQHLLLALPSWRLKLADDIVQALKSSGRKPDDRRKGRQECQSKPRLNLHPRKSRRHSKRRSKH